MCYWPHSIDPLKPERARIDGMKPTFYSDHEDVYFSPFPGILSSDSLNRLLLRNHSFRVLEGGLLNLVQSSVCIPLMIPVHSQLILLRYPCKK